METIRTIVLFVIAIFVVVSFYKTYISIEKLESVLEELYEEAFEALKELKQKELNMNKRKYRGKRVDNNVFVYGYYWQAE